MDPGEMLVVVQSLLGPVLSEWNNTNDRKYTIDLGMTAAALVMGAKVSSDLGRSDDAVDAMNLAQVYRQMARDEIDRRRGVDRRVKEKPLTLGICSPCRQAKHEGCTRDSVPCECVNSMHTGALTPEEIEKVAEDPSFGPV